MHLHVFSISRAEFWFGALSARHQGPSSDLARLPRRRLGCSGRAFLHQVHRKRGRLSHFLWFWSSWYQFFDWINCAYWEILNFFVPLGLFAVTRSSGVRQWSQLHVFFYHMSQLHVHTAQQYLLDDCLPAELQCCQFTALSSPDCRCMCSSNSC